MKLVIFYSIITFSYTNDYVHSYTVDVVFTLPYKNIGEMCLGWFRQWFVASSSSRQYPKQPRLFLNNNLAIKLQWDSKHFLFENTCENGIWKPSATLFRSECVDLFLLQHIQEDQHENKNNLHPVIYHTTTEWALKEWPLSRECKLANALFFNWCCLIQISQKCVPKCTIKTKSILA